MKLFLHGGGKLDRYKLPAFAKRIKDELDGSKNGELFSTHQLAATLGVAANRARDIYNYLPDYTHKIGNVRYWGKPATIQQLIKETK